MTFVLSMSRLYVCAYSAWARDIYVTSRMNVYTRGPGRTDITYRTGPRRVRQVGLAQARPNYRRVGRGVSWLPGNPPFGLKSGRGTLNAARSCERYWAQERIKYTTMGTRVNGAPGFTSIRSSLAEPGLAREGVAGQATSAAPGIPLASVYAI